MSEPKLIYPLLCEAWGESDLPCAFIAYTEAEVRKFIVSDWLGNDKDPYVDTVLADLRDHDWKDEPEWNAEFEIGGVSFKPVYESNSRAAVQAAQPEAVGEVITWALNGDKTCGYNNWLGETLFGRILITWKGWKETPDACVDEFPGELPHFYGSPDKVKEAAEAEFNRRLRLASAPTEPMSAPTAEPVAWTLTETLTRGKTTTTGYLWFTDPQNSGWTALYAAPPSAATPEPSDAEREALRYAEMSMAAMRDALMPSFEYVGVSLRVSQEDHAAIRSALASMSTALHMVRAAIHATKGGKL